MHACMYVCMYVWMDGCMYGRANALVPQALDDRIGNRPPCRRGPVVDVSVRTPRDAWGATKDRFPFVGSGQTSTLFTNGSLRGYSLAFPELGVAVQLGALEQCSF